MRRRQQILQQAEKTRKGERPSMTWAWSLSLSCVKEQNGKAQRRVRHDRRCFH
jgi:hypothetical protein